MVDVHPSAGAAQLVGHEVRRRGRRIGVRHLEHRSDPAEGRSARARLEVFLPFEARLAKVDLRVDHAGQHVQALRLEDLSGGFGGKAADRGDAAVAHRHVGLDKPSRGEHAAVLQDQIVSG
jgi:hypothetical protein